MKKEARILKRERQRIEYENKIVELAEKKLLGKNQEPVVRHSPELTEMLMRYGVGGDAQTIASWVKGNQTPRIRIDASLRGVSVTHYVHDEIVVMWDPAVNEGWARAADVLHVLTPAPDSLARPREGKIGAVAIRLPGAKERFVSITDPTKADLIDHAIDMAGWTIASTL